MNISNVKMWVWHVDFSHGQVIKDQVAALDCGEAEGCSNASGSTCML